MTKQLFCLIGEKRKQQLLRIVLPSCNWFYRCPPTTGIRSPVSVSGFIDPCDLPASEVRQAFRIKDVSLHHGYSFCTHTHSIAKYTAESNNIIYRKSKFGLYCLRLNFLIKLIIKTITKTITATPRISQIAKRMFPVKFIILTPPILTLSSAWKRLLYIFLKCSIN